MTKPHEPQRKALGRGLGSLLPLTKSSSQIPQSSSTHPHTLPIDVIQPNPLQPRTAFQPDRLRELADSIRANGVIQPLIVRKKDDHYELIAGERRWRAAKLAGLDEVPVVVQDLADEKLLEVSLIENIQREDLNPIEVAQAFDRLARQHNLTHEEISRRTGKDRSTITNTIRLLRLPDDIQVLLAEHRLSMGHARAILGLPTPELQQKVAEKAVSQGLSVRQVERLVQRMSEPRKAEEPEQQTALDPNVKAALRHLEQVLGTRVRIQQKSARQGHIEIEFYSMDDLDRIYQIIVGEGKAG